MFCQNCGKENSNGAKFCRGCGNPMIAKAVPSQQAAPCPAPDGTASAKSNPISDFMNKLTKKQKTMLIIAVSAVVLVIVLVIIFVSSCGAQSPESLVKNYVSAFNSGRTDKIMNCYYDGCISYYKDNHPSCTNIDYLEYYDEFYDDFSDRIITSFEIEEIEYYDKDHEFYEYMLERGINVKGGARAIVDMNFERSDADAYIFMLKTGSGWYIYMVNDWY